AEKTLDEIVASHLTWLGNSDKTQRQRAARSHDRLVEIGAPAVPALVARLYDERGKTQRFAILQVLGAIGEQGVAEAITALQAASTHDEPGISGPAKAVLKKTGLGG
ncbi:MAG: hypothetical protein JW910_05630, partial [Anaerolineae bacterium]|nr:hypothetical protein [Anaerolineae bacterium]